MGASLGMVSAALADAGTDAAGMSAALQNVPAAVRQPAYAQRLRRKSCGALGLSLRFTGSYDYVAQYPWMISRLFPERQKRCHVGPVSLSTDPKQVQATDTTAMMFEALTICLLRRRLRSRPADSMPLNLC